jgi:uncharacterized membrane protein
METKKNKYDTNPLDPEAERKAAESWNSGSGGDTQQVHRATRDVGRTANENSRQDTYSEAPTRKIDGQTPDAPYPSVFIPPTYAPPTQYQAPPQGIYAAPAVAPSSRSVQGIGLPERWAVMLAYAPFYVGLVVSLLELFLVPRKEVRVRLHAAQALSLHIAILIVHTVFGVIGSITDSSFGGFLFKLAAFIFLIVSMVRVWKGEPHRIAPVAEPAQWFNEHIEPRNQS